MKSISWANFVSLAHPTQTADATSRPTLTPARGVFLAEVCGRAEGWAQLAERLPCRRTGNLGIFNQEPALPQVLANLIDLERRRQPLNTMARRMKLIGAARNSAPAREATSKWWSDSAWQTGQITAQLWLPDDPRWWARSPKLRPLYGWIRNIYSDGGRLPVMLISAWLPSAREARLAERVRITWSRDLQR